MLKQAKRGCQQNSLLTLVFIHQFTQVLSVIDRKGWFQHLFSLQENDHSTFGEGGGGRGIFLSQR